jgi:PadR family transcriptional regulator AphA
MNTHYSKTIFTLLSLLTIESMSGYDIKLALKKMTKSFWSESDGQIYPGLQQCVNDALATVKADATATNHLHKKMYTITPKGRSVLNSWLLCPQAKITHRDESLLKLTFLNHEQQHQAEQLLLNRLKTAKNDYMLLMKQANSTSEAIKALPYFLMLQNRQKIMLEAEIQWIELSLTALALQNT